MSTEAEQGVDDQDLNAGTQESETVTGTQTDDSEGSGSETNSATDQSNQESEQGQPEGDDVSDEVVVSIGDEEPPPSQDEAKAPEWVRELRKQKREDAKRIRNLEAQLAQHTTEKQPVELGQEPKLEDFDFDTEKYKAALSGWLEQKRVVDAEAEKAKQQQKAQEQSWQEKLTTYGEEKSNLKVSDFDEAESSVQSTLNTMQQGIILQGAEKPALTIYALGKNPKKAQELASITDPVKFAFAVAKLEKDLKVSNRKAPPPESKINGNSRPSGSVDSTLETLRSEAARTGDYTKVFAYNQKRKAAKPK